MTKKPTILERIARREARRRLDALRGAIAIDEASRERLAEIALPTNASPREIAELSKLANDLAKTTQFSRTEVARALVKAFERGEAPAAVGARLRSAGLVVTALRVKIPPRSKRRFFFDREEGE